jgi:hypothetical protein
VTLFEVAAGPTPALLVAVTEKVYAVPFVRPETTTGLAEAVTESPPGLEVTVYAVMGEPPLAAGGEKVTEAKPSPATAETLRGTPGRPAGVAAVEAEDAALVPAVLLAVTVHV